MFGKLQKALAYLDLVRRRAATDQEPVPVDELDEGVTDGVAWNQQQLLK